MTEFNTIEQALIKKRFTFFAPKDKRHLLDLHPHLEEYVEFSPDRLSQHELLFTWYFASPCSPFRNMPKEQRIREACQASFDKWEQRFEEYKHGFSEQMREANERWASFEIGALIQAKVILEKRMADIRMLMGMDVTEALKGENGQTDWGIAKDHTDVMNKCGKELIEISRQLATGLISGIQESGEADEELGIGELASIALTRT